MLIAALGNLVRVSFFKPGQGRVQNLSQDAEAGTYPKHWDSEPKTVVKLVEHLKNPDQVVKDDCHD